jgi:hypothetical protein
MKALGIIYICIYIYICKYIYIYKVHAKPQERKYVYTWTNVCMHIYKHTEAIILYPHILIKLIQSVFTKLHTRTYMKHVSCKHIRTYTSTYYLYTPNPSRAHACICPLRHHNPWRNPGAIAHTCAHNESYGHIRHLTSHSGSA